MTYSQDVGPYDTNGKKIVEGDRIVVGANQGVRVGKVIAVKTYEHQNWQGVINGYSYSVSIMRELPISGRQTFNHDLMGESKFWVISDLTSTSD